MRERAAANYTLHFTIGSLAVTKARLTTTGTKNSAAGSYPITVSAGTLTSANYGFTLVNGTLTVTN